MTIKKLKSIDIINVLSDLVSKKLETTVKLPVKSGRYIVFLFSATKFSGDLRGSNEGEVGWFTKEEMKNIHLVNHFFEHLDVFEGEYSEYIYESEDSIKIY